MFVIRFKTSTIIWIRQFEKIQQNITNKFGGEKIPQAHHLFYSN
jgi:hypothetical protein